MIVVDVETKPRAVSFGQISKGEKSTREFSTKVNEPEKMKITSVTVEDERFELNLKNGDAAQGAKYEVAFLGSQDLGRISTKIQVTYEGNEEGKPSSVQTPVRVNVVGNLRYSKNIYFLKRDGQFKSRDIVITTRSGQPIEIKSIEDPDKQLKTEITEAKGQRVSVRAEVADPEAEYKKPSRHTLTINTTDKDEPKIDVSYTISERRARPGKQRVNAPLIKPIGMGKSKPVNNKAAEPNEVPK